MLRGLYRAGVMILSGYTIKGRLLAAESLLDYQKPIVALERQTLFQELEDRELRGAIELLLAHYLYKQKRFHVTDTPKIESDTAFEVFKNQFFVNGNVKYRIRLNLEESGETIGVTLKAQSIEDESASKEMSLSFSKDTLSDFLPELESKVTQFLRELDLIDRVTEHQFQKHEKNELLVNAISSVSTPQPTIGHYKSTIKQSREAIESGLGSPFLQKLYWDSVYNIVFKHNIFEHREIEYFRQSLQSAGYSAIHGDTAKRYLIAYKTWKQYKREAVNDLYDLVRQGDVNEKTLSLLSENLVLLEESDFRTSAVNYYYNPFSESALQRYRHNLIDDKQFAKALQLNETYLSWNKHSSNWLIHAESKDTMTSLAVFSKWYREHIHVGVINRYSPERNVNSLEHNENSPEPAQGQFNESNHQVVGQSVPSQYIGYILLNANRPDLAKHWVKYGKEQNSIFFDVLVIPLLSDLWAGTARIEDWLNLLSFSEDRYRYQTTSDKIAMAYLSLYFGISNSAEEYLVDVYPEFKRKNVQVDNDNFRYLLYYREALKFREGEVSFDKLLELDEAMVNYLSARASEELRNHNFGISDVEFYALSGDTERALSLLSEAVYEQGWMPNALWLWPPLDKNVFLKNLYLEPRFLAINEYVNKKLEGICLSNLCQNDES